ncbi:MAG: hypothetical protein CMF08_06785 [Idiomarina sp.]|nr:hypothetical protein [Idiomarina sp.]
MNVEVKVSGDNGRVKFPQKLLPQSDAQWIWLYNEFVRIGKLDRTISPPDLKERKEKLTNFFDLEFGVSEQRQTETSRLAEMYHNKYFVSGLSESDLGWLLAKDVEAELLYLAWLIIVRTTSMDQQATQQSAGFDLKKYRDADEEHESVFFEPEKGSLPLTIFNQTYLMMKLPKALDSRQSLKWIILDFVSSWHQDQRPKRDYIRYLKRMIDDSKASKWCLFAKGSDEKLLEWLWAYLRGNDSKIGKRHRMPGMLSDGMDKFKFERIYAEFFLWNRSPEFREGVQKQAIKALKQKAKERQDPSARVRKNFSLSRHTLLLIDKLSGGKGNYSNYLEGLVAADYARARGLEQNVVNETQPSQKPDPIMEETPITDSITKEFKDKRS